MPPIGNRYRGATQQQLLFTSLSLSSVRSLSRREFPLPSLFLPLVASVRTPASPSPPLSPYFRYSYFYCISLSGVSQFASFFFPLSDLSSRKIFQRAASPPQTTTKFFSRCLTLLYSYPPSWPSRAFRYQATRPKSLLLAVISIGPSITARIIATR